VSLTAGDIVAYHERSGAYGHASHPAVDALARREATRQIDDVRVAVDLPEEYGFLFPDRRLTPATASIVRGAYRKLPGAEGEDVRFLLRNPWDLPNAARIPELFPETKFVFVVRDPVATIDSQLRAARLLLAEPSEYHALLDLRYRQLLRRRGRLAFYRFLARQPRFVDVLTRSFARGTRRWIQDLDRLPPRMWVLVRYEDLLADPARELSRLYAFLGLPTEGIEAVAREVRPGARALDPHVLAREDKIRSRARRFRERFGY
jgi:hypothetical protein